MTRAVFVALLVLAGASNARPADPPVLTIGSPAPKLEPAAFLMGDPVKELRKGTVYVVEFSGTQCVPCVKCIPHLTELQKKHKGVVIVSVYSGESKDEVDTFLTKHRNKIGYRVAIDPEGSVAKIWSDAALREGIPDAFIVDATGTIAWIGPPAEMSEPLARVVDGTFDGRFDALRLRVKQGVAQKERLATAREKMALAAYDRINKQIIKGELADAMTATEAALKEYADVGNGFHILQGAKLYLLARSPGRKDAAVDFAVELAVARKLSQNYSWSQQFAGALINAADTPDPADRDARLLDLAVAVLQDLEECLPDLTRGRSKEQIQSYRISTNWQSARAHHLRKNHHAAVRHMEAAITLLKESQPVTSEDTEEFKTRREKTLARFASDLARYKAAAEPPPNGKEPTPRPNQ